MCNNVQLKSCEFFQMVEMIEWNIRMDDDVQSPQKDDAKTELLSFFSRVKPNFQLFVYTVCGLSGVEQLKRHWFDEMWFPNLLRHH